jgi:hypothetical protein
LGRWCSETRVQLELYQAKKDVSQLSSIQASQLRQLRFCMDPIRNLSTKPVWNENYYQQLQAFYQVYGHSKVPCKPCTGFVSWVSKLREAYQRKQQGGQTTLTDQHIARLDHLEFQWKPRQRSTFQKNATKWLAYKAEHGQEPTSEYALGKWVYDTRRKFSDFQAGRPTPLTQANVDQLTEWGFKWKSKYKTPQVTFDKRMLDLKEYKAKFGDTVVPQAYPGLGAWVRTMRKDYNLLLEGRKSAMTEERLEKLRQAGFHFEIVANAILVKQKREAYAKAMQVLAKAVSQETPGEESVSTITENSNDDALSGTTFLFPTPPHSSSSTCLGNNGEY